EIMERQSKLFMEYDNLRAAFFAAAFAPTIELEANFYNDTLVGPNIVSGLTEPLDGYAYWDVVNYKKVSLGQSYLGR
ncbi:MAG TPA: hypothetical protein VN132_02715, partial [Bdellovibrio sp.]|nr:hypothetical protein [Bdellovibrio sp.]